MDSTEGDRLDTAIGHLPWWKVLAAVAVGQLVNFGIWIGMGWSETSVETALTDAAGLVGLSLVFSIPPAAMVVAQGWYDGK